MKLNKIFIGAFGGLKNYTLELSSGFNVIFGENENGKSTVMAFIKMMFYGSGKKLQQLSASPRVKYTPWNGDAMCGRIYFEHGGTSYCLEREFRKSDSTDRVTLLNLDLGTSETAPSDVGQSFFGLSSAAFERSCFISTPDISSKGASAAGELDAKLSNLVLTGDETTSYQEVAARLEAAKEKLISKSKRNGEYVKNAAQLEALEDELRTSQEAAIRRTSLTERAEQLKKKYTALKAEYDDIKEITAREGDIRNAEKLKEYLAAKSELDTLAESLRLSDGKTADESFAKTVAFALNRYESQNEKAQHLKDEALHLNEALRLSSAENGEHLAEEKAELEKRLTTTEADMGRTSAALQAANENAISAKLALEGGKSAKSPTSVALIVAGGAFAVISLVTALVCASLIGGAVVALYATALIGIAAVIAGVLTGRSATKKRLIRLKAEYSAAAEKIAELKTRGEKEQADCGNIRKQLSVVETALSTNGAIRAQREAELEEKRLSAQNEFKKATSDLEDLLKLFARYKKADTAEQVKAELEVLNSGAEQLKAIKQRLAYLSRDLGEISYETAAEKLKALNEESIGDIDFDAARAKQEELRESITEVMTQTSAIIAELKTAFSALRDPLTIEKDIKEIKQVMLSQRAHYTAAETALEVLGESFAEVRRGYGSTLEKEAAAIFARLTAGRYGTLNVSKALDMTAEQTDRFGTRELGYLSTGTVDQAYLSLRLAISALISNDEPLPLFMDDILDRCDDRRTAEAVAFLKEYCESTQGILFTCHGAVCEAARQCNAEIIKL